MIWWAAKWSQTNELSGHREHLVTVDWRREIAWPLAIPNPARMPGMDRKGIRLHQAPQGFENGATLLAAAQGSQSRDS